MFFSEFFLEVHQHTLSLEHLDCEGLRFDERWTVLRDLAVQIGPFWWPGGLGLGVDG